MTNRLFASSHPNTPEKILCAYVTLSNGLRITCARHSDKSVIDTIMTMRKAGMDVDMECDHNGGQGFVTTHGRYVDRQEAMMIARHQNQLLGEPVIADTLFSEDIY